MAGLTIPNADVPIAGETAITPLWYRKLLEWRDRINAIAVSGNLTVTATSNTNLRFSYRGSDGVTRTADITLS